MLTLYWLFANGMPHVHHTHLQEQALRCDARSLGRLLVTFQLPHSICGNPTFARILP